METLEQIDREMQALRGKREELTKKLNLDSMKIIKNELGEVVSLEGFTYEPDDVESKLYGLGFWGTHIAPSPQSSMNTKVKVTFERA